jgi:hypothetical protein
MTLTKTFESSDHDCGRSTSLSITVDYDPDDQTYSFEKASSYSEKDRVVTDLTEQFENFSLFNNAIYQIDWSEVYAEEMAARENYEEVNY